MTSREDNEQSSTDLDKPSALVASSSAKAPSVSIATSSTTTTPSLGSSTDHASDTTPESTNIIAFSESHSIMTTEGDDNAPSLTRRKSSMMSAKAASSEKHVTIDDAITGDAVGTTGLSNDTTAVSKDESETKIKDEESSKKELASILQQFDPLVESKHRNTTTPPSTLVETCGTKAESGTIPLSPDMSLSSSSSPRTPQLDSPRISHSVQLAMTEKASKSQMKKSEGGQRSTLSTGTLVSKSSSKGTTTTSNNNSSNGSEPPKPKEIPFDFHKFLEQMRHRKFDKKPWTVNEQIKIIHDFLDFITNKMEMCDLWKDASDQEFENVKEGMEKLVMNRLFTYTFSPSTTDDAERDEVLNQKIRIFRWIREEHLDIPNSPHNEAYLNNAQSELKKINSYKAPRDKVISLIRRSEGSSKGADTFLPILIYVVLRSNPPNLVSNVQYISRFRNPEKLQAEAGYYLASLMGAISFIENLEASSLSISLEEFDYQIEKTMDALGQEKNDGLASAEAAAATTTAMSSRQEQSGQVLQKKQDSKLATLLAGTSSTRSSRQRSAVSPPLSEKQALAQETQNGKSPQQHQFSERPHHVSRGGSESSSNLNYSRISSAPSSVIINPAAALIERGANFATKTMQKPLDLIERMFQDSGDNGEMAKPYPPRLHQPNPTVRPSGTSPHLPQRPVHQNNRQNSFQDFVYVPAGENIQQPSPHQPVFQQQQNIANMQQYPGNLSEVPPNSEHTWQRTISGGGQQHVQQHQPRRQTAEQYQQALETLADMFPSCERQVCDVILQANDGRLSPSIDTLLEISSATQDQARQEENLLLSVSPPTLSTNTIAQQPQGTADDNHLK
ncbi:hypothetical protein BG004_005844 [Podila humilis]|nr:hypothetical protein BG004_005844 [Podila humilis]